VSYRRPTVSTFDATVVVGNATPEEKNDAPQVIARLVPSSLMRTISLSKFAGDPDRFVDIEVIAVFKAVIVTASQASVFIVGVAELVMVVTAKLRAPEAPVAPVAPVGPVAPVAPVTRALTLALSKVNDVPVVAFGMYKPADVPVWRAASVMVYDTAFTPLIVMVNVVPAANKAATTLFVADNPMLPTVVLTPLTRLTKAHVANEVLHAINT
jgi:hypothetical protein